MGKLGKKARKFARKNLQSVLKKKRKLNSLFKKRKTSRGEHVSVEEVTGDTTGPSNGSEFLNESIGDDSLSIISTEEDDYLAEDASDSDGYLSEDSACLHAGQSGIENPLEESVQGYALSSENRKIWLKLSKKKEKLGRLKENPKFKDFLSNHAKDLDSLLKKDMYSDEDEASDDDIEFANGDLQSYNQQRLLTASIINSWSETAIQQCSLTTVPSLLNAYRVACEYGTDSPGAYQSVPYLTLQDSNAFLSIIMFILREIDGIFRSQLGIMPSNCKPETILQMENSSKWKTLKPMVKSYLKSTLFLLNQLADTEILVYALSRLRASVIFFSVFPSLLLKLIQVAVDLWTTRGGIISSCSFDIICDVAYSFAPDCVENCLKKVYKAFIARCRGVGPGNLRHIESLRDSCVVFYSIDMQKSVSLAMLSIQKLAKMFQLGLRTKNKEILKKICSWEYILCLELWVKFCAANIRDNDLSGLLYPMIQLVNGIVYLFPGPRYFPLRVRCIQLLNHLSSSSGTFIPVSSLIVDMLEYRTAKEVGNSEKIVDVSSSLKLPKNWLKSQKFQEECALAAIELLSAHFEQWSYHISFPEIATIPMIYLRKFTEKLAVESLRQTMKRLIDQVEKNVDFIQRKRDEVSFSLRDQVSVDSFLQLEKGSSNASFTQFYRSIMQKAISRNAMSNNEKSWVKKANPGKRKRKQPKVASSGRGSDKHDSVEGNILRTANTQKSKRQRT